MTAPGALPTREDLDELLSRHLGGLFARDVPTERLARAVADLHTALLARLQPAREQQNNVVACVNCKKPVTITALNAVRCDDCGDALRADLAKWENPEGAVMSGGVVDWKKAYQFSRVKLKDTEENLRACAQALSKLTTAFDLLYEDEPENAAEQEKVLDRALDKARAALARPGVQAERKK